MDAGSGHSPCHHAAANPLTVAPGPAHNTAPCHRASAVNSWSVAKYTRGCTRIHDPDDTRRPIADELIPSAKA